MLCAFGLSAQEKTFRVKSHVDVLWLWGRVVVSDLLEICCVVVGWRFRLFEVIEAGCPGAVSHVIAFWYQWTRSGKLSAGSGIDLRVRVTPAKLPRSFVFLENFPDQVLRVLERGLRDLRCQSVRGLNLKLNARQSVAPNATRLFVCGYVAKPVTRSCGSLPLGFATQRIH